MHNIELFNLAVGETLGYCYEHFPRRVEVNADFISKRVCEFYDIDLVNDAFINEATEVSGATIIWLVNAGYLWIEENYEFEFSDVTLTPKSLSLLNVVPESLDGTIGSKLVSGVKASSKSVASSLMTTLLSEGVKLSLGTGI
ncbi:hypothetical protein SNR37_003107 [Agarivorans aestuarii]|uniref:Uncharacterized protein n=1 Tax=Agarivorans aestuarii TaxID=1563703 RepID=A0ABU7G2Y8_9ALTE|nr:hypothetical protein [Agarivorans aestuarii]MEE1673681.1 hypothetical protein [Agarivorans aestuarii]